MLHRLPLAVLALALSLGLPARAQDISTYPNRAVRIIVPYPAGGSADLMPRILAERLSAKWGQPVLVENRPGAGGNVGAEVVYKSDPDGYTLFATAPGPLVVNQNLYRTLPFDPTQFVPVTVMGLIPNVLLVNPNVSAKSVQSLIALARLNPGTLNYGSQGNGTTSHLTAELFKSMAGGLKITHVPYKGSAPELAALMGGEIELAFDNLGVTLPHIKSGRLRVLAVCSEKPIADLPGVPTLSAILPGFVSVTWFGIVAPPKTPMPIAEKISAAVAEAFKDPAVRKRFAGMNAEPVGNTPAEMAAFMKQDGERWAKVIRAAGVKVD